MRNLIAVLFFCTIQNLLYAQTSDWQAHLVVEQPWNGNTDTITIGLDYDATDGYDPAWDLIDTNFQYPLSMRSRINSLEVDSGFCAANMKKNIKAFAPVVTWDIYIKADTFEYSAFDLVLFKWDTAEFNYEDEHFFLEYALISSITGYIDGIDATTYCLATNTFLCEGASGGAHEDTELYAILGIWPDEYFFGTCSTEENIFKLTLKVVFTDFLPVSNPTESTFNVINNINGSTLQIDFKSNGKKSLHLFDLMGKCHLSINSIYENHYIIDYSFLSSGQYILKYQMDSYQTEVYEFIKP